MRHKIYSVYHRWNGLFALIRLKYSFLARYASSCRTANSHAGQKSFLFVPGTQYTIFLFSNPFRNDFTRLLWVARLHGSEVMEMYVITGYIIWYLKRKKNIVCNELELSPFQNKIIIYKIISDYEYIFMIFQWIEKLMGLSQNQTLRFEVGN